MVLFPQKRRSEGKGKESLSDQVMHNIMDKQRWNSIKN
jgi:hypothetical protein